MRIWNTAEAKSVEVKVGTRCVVARCGSGRTYFGEFGTVIKELKNHLVIATDSGTIVKVNDSFITVGKAHKSDYWASLKVDGREDMIISRVSYWNDKKTCMEYK